MTRPRIGMDGTDEEEDDDERTNQSSSVDEDEFDEPV